MMNVLEGLKPERVFYYFEQICRIPHGSYHVRQVSDYCMHVAQELGLEARQDELFNVVIKKPASAGYPSDQVLLLQGHLDMVCVKNPDVSLDMDREGLVLGVKDGYVHANGTSLGADDGIAVAMILAILEDPAIAHPALEAVFTVQEEVGMEGADFLDVSDLHASLMLNLDSECEGTFLAGCAGGASALAQLTPETLSREGKLYTLQIGGLLGGHSGAEIHKGRANANVLLGRLLLAIYEQFPFLLVQAGGGEKDNAIPDQASAQFLAEPACDDAALRAVFEELTGQIRAEYTGIEEGMTIQLSEPSAECLPAVCQEDTKKILFLLFEAPDAVQGMSRDLPGIVETSLNLGIFRASQEKASFTWSVRSCVRSKKRYLLDKLRYLAILQGCSFSLSGDYPEWPYDPDSKICSLAADLYRQYTGQEPCIEMIHAGLECGIFSDKMPGLDIVSMGPDIHDIHTPRERLDIASTERCWQLVLGILEHLHELV